jgi:hypothetical protein
MSRPLSLRFMENPRISRTSFAKCRADGYPLPTRRDAMRLPLCQRFTLSQPGLDHLLPLLRFLNNSNTSVASLSVMH